MESNFGKKIVGKPRTPSEVQRSTIMPRSWIDGRTMKHTEIPKKQKNGTKPHCKYLAYLNTVHISYKAPSYQRSRYEHQNVSKSGDPDEKRDFEKTTKV